jgi:hypothetical protein
MSQEHDQQQGTMDYAMSTICELVANNRRIQSIRVIPDHTAAYLELLRYQALARERGLAMVLLESGVIEIHLRRTS